MKQTKKAKFFALGIVAALVGALLLTACGADEPSSSSDILSPVSNSVSSDDDNTASVPDSLSYADSVSGSGIDSNDNTEDDETPGANGNSLSKQDAANLETADFEGHIGNISLPNSSFTISAIEQGAIEGMMIVDLEGGEKNIVYNENTVFIKSISNDAEKTTDYFEGTENDLKAGVYVKVWGSEVNGVVTATKVLVMTN